MVKSADSVDEGSEARSQPVPDSRTTSHEPEPEDALRGCNCGEEETALWYEPIKES